MGVFVVRLPGERILSTNADLAIAVTATGASCGRFWRSTQKKNNLPLWRCERGRVQKCGENDLWSTGPAHLLPLPDRVTSAVVLSWQLIFGESFRGTITCFYQINFSHLRKQPSGKHYTVILGKRCFFRRNTQGLMRRSRTRLVSTPNNAAVGWTTYHTKLYLNVFILATSNILIEGSNMF
jgi:hypothetical protein